ncbi:hypothetical protein [Streptomyces sp. GQFP]|uniref:hypothetical protein n=1 Tax=Streptomyces sp. GQFP TaxID=2907545 RepID=UPI001F2260F9|nr:hypothetical protein [Streptomyces sp. GQFP]UIX31412.1 hypothetical protein LUX31_15985 [Streptomyces sp. GQFP]
MSATESTSAPKRRAVSGVSMRELLAAGAAARAVSTPPRVPDAPLQQRPKAA